MKYRYSIVIPARNAEATIEYTLEALVSQSIPRSFYEIIVVDDGSDDQTADRSRAYADTVIQQSHAGPAAARNRGVDASDGEIIVFTDSDCIPQENWLERLTEPFSDPDVVAVKGAYKTSQRGIVPRFAQIEFEERYTKLRRYDRIDFVDTYSAAVLRSAFIEIGGFDPRFPKADNEDVDFSYKLAARGYLMKFIPEAIVHHRHPRSIGTYLRTKFKRAYWRAMVYRRHPAKLLADSYTPQLLKLQTCIALFIPVSLIMGIFISVFRWLFLILLCAYILSSIPLIRTAIRFDRRIWLIALPLAFLRGLALALGAIVGGLSHRHKDLLIPTLLVGADILALIGALLCAFYLRAGLLQDIFTPFVHDLRTYLTPLPLVLILWLGSFAYLNLYATRVHTTPFIEFLNVLKASILSLLLLMSFSFLTKFDYSRFLVLFFFFSVVPFTVLFRSGVRTIQKRLLRGGYRTVRCLIVGTGETANALIKHLSALSFLGYKTVGRVGPKPDDLHDDIPWIGPNVDIGTLITRYGIDEVYLADMSLSPVETMALAVSCDSAGASCKVLSGFSQMLDDRKELGDMTHIPMVDLSKARFGLIQSALKRMMDLLIASILFLGGSPFLLSGLILVRIKHRGPLFATEDRVGIGGHIFHTYRLSIAGNDIISLLLLKSGLDRLPRLIAVLRGEMSLVGTRGEPPEAVADNPPWERLFLEVKPGLSGLWLVGRAGDLPIASDEEYDFYYLRNRSLLLDIVILIRTLPALWRTERMVD